jgi:hypothetical protein
MPGFGVTVRAALGLLLAPLIAAFVQRVAGPMLDLMESAPIVQDSGTPDAVSRAIEFVGLAVDNFLLVMIVSAVVLWLTNSYLNSEVRV